jgi:hypothetical protein
MVRSIGALVHNSFVHGPCYFVTVQVQEREPFIDRMWLLQRGPLRKETVLEYFGLSRFYDRQSNNEELRMQGYHVSDGDTAGWQPRQYVCPP